MLSRNSKPNGEKKMTASELVKAIAPNNPGKRFAVSLNEDVIGVYSDEANRFVSCASLSLTGEWVKMPYEILVNGKLPITDWKEVN